MAPRARAWVLRAGGGLAAGLLPFATVALYEEGGIWWLLALAYGGVGMGLALVPLPVAGARAGTSHRGLRPTSATDNTPPSGTSWRQLHAPAGFKTRIRDTVIAPWQAAAEAGQPPINAPKGVLLVGASAAGTTGAMRSLASELGARVFRIETAAIVEKPPEEAATSLLRTFQTAKAKAPSLVFVAGIDGLAADQTQPIALERRKAQLREALVRELDGLAWGQRAVVVASATDLRRVPEELRAPGRLDVVAHLDAAEERAPSTGATPPPSSPQPIERQFEIVRELGRGAFAKALLARDRTLDRQVVLKVPLVAWTGDPQMRELFLREARLAAKVQHANVVTIHAVLADHEPPIIVLEYVDGGSLEKRATGDRRPTPRECVRIGVDIAAGLAQIHRQGIVHRDVKPANVLLTRAGVAKVADFGIARPPPSIDTHSTLASSGFQPGSLAFMSPEQARGEPVDARSDIYSAGLTLLYALRGAPVLDLSGRTEFAARALVASTDVRASLAGLPPRTQEALAMALAPEPADRHANALAFRAKLVEALQADPPR